MFRGSSHCSTCPPSHRKIFTMSSTQDFPHREPPLRIWVIQTGSTQLLSLQQYNLYTRGKAQYKSPLHLEGWALSQTRSTSHKRDKAQSHNTTTSPLYLEGYQHNQTHPQLPLTRGITQSKEGFNSWWYQQPQTNFVTKTRSYR